MNLKMLLAFCLLFTFQVNGQGVAFNLLHTFSIGEEDVWAIDGIGNVIVSNRDQLKKYNTDGKLLFEQSQKSFGRLDKIESMNSLKFVAFSAEQQTLCFFDNSLTVMENCLELSDYSILNATQFAVSGQSDKIWVFDQVNSTMSLLSLSGLNQNQQIKNMMGILNAENIIQMAEMENKLFFVDSISGVFILDLYGTLIQKIEMVGVKWIQFKDGNALMLKDNSLFIYNLSTSKQERVQLPKSDYTEFLYNGKSIFFRSKDTIEKFEFLLTN